MIGRADIEGSKSNVAMNAWLPQAAYPRVISQSRTRVKLNRAVPVLSRLFDARGRDPEGPVPSPSPAGTRQPALAAEQLEQSADSRRVRAGTPCPALEPILFPRLRIHFADFPCLHCSIDRGCSPWRPDAVMSTTGVGGTRSSGFSRAAGAHRHHATCGALPAAGPYLRPSRFQGGQAVKRKRELFPRPPPTSPTP
ncbi:hypothetical protein K1719_047184 [Acacia pycnantha]|nr:hypothetical protein K1719_047184 [Acacia pycnantha]